MQHAGSHLQELQRAFKNPTANLGLIFSEAGRRAGAAVGLAGGPDLAPLLAPALRPAGAELVRVVGEAGRAAEAALARHGKRVVDEQQLLTRLADAAIDSYTTAAVLARASRAERLQLPAAAHELALAEAWAHEALGRAARALADCRAAPEERQRARLAALGSQVAAAGGALHRNPLNL